MLKAVNYLCEGVHVDRTGDRWRVWLKYSNGRTPDEAGGPLWMYGTLSVHSSTDGADERAALARAIDAVTAHAERIGVAWDAPVVIWAAMGEDVERRRLVAEQADRMGWRFR